MTTPGPSINTLLDVDAPGHPLLRGRVADREDDSLMLSVSQPATGRATSVALDTLIQYRWTRGDGVWTQPARVSAFDDTPVERRWIVRPVDAPCRNQRRQAFRVTSALPLEASFGPRTYQGRTQDVSVTGMGMKLPDALAPAIGSVVSLRFTFVGQTFRCQGEVVRSSNAFGGAELGVQFTDLDRAVAESLARCLTRLQLEQRRRGTARSGRERPRGEW
jgi:hypothetical protein